MQRRSPLPRTFPGLDVTRAVAAVMVVICHAVRASTTWNPAWSVLHPAGSQQIANVMDLFGAWGVGLFFVLSGFCIHLPQARARALGEVTVLDVKAYFRRRARRIYPPHLVALLGSALVAFTLEGPIAALRVHPMISVPTTKQLLAHLLLIHSFFPSAFSSVNHVLWSIAVEAHFYLLYPVLFWATRRVALWKCVVVLFIASMAIRLGAHGLPESAKAVLAQSVLCRFWEWTLGCVAVEWVCHRGVEYRPSLALLFAGMALSFVLGFLVSGLPYAAIWRGTLWPALFGVVLVASAGAKVSEKTWIVGLGRRSYSLYLTHPVALTLALVAARRWNLPFWAEWLFAVPLTVAVMLFFFRVAEQPFMKKANVGEVSRQPLGPLAPQGVVPK